MARHSFNNGRAVFTSQHDHKKEVLRSGSLEVLSRLEGFLRALPSGAYARSLSEQGSTIGDHMRHIANHYDLILGALEGKQSRIDLIARNRMDRIATDHREALRRVQSYRERIEGMEMPDLERLLYVRDQDDMHSDPQELPQCAGALMREKLSQHSIHHLAVMYQMAIQLDKGFRYAASHTNAFSTPAQPQARTPK